MTWTQSHLLSVSLKPGVQWPSLLAIKLREQRRRCVGWLNGAEQSLRGWSILIRRRPGRSTSGHSTPRVKPADASSPRALVNRSLAGVSTLSFPVYQTEDRHFANAGQGTANTPKPRGYCFTQRADLPGLRHSCFTLTKRDSTLSVGG